MADDKSAPHRLGLLLVPGFSHMGLTQVTEPLFIANWLAGQPLFRWTTLSADGFAVRASSGAALPVDSPLTSDMPFDTVLVIASFDARSSATDPRVTRWLRQAARQSVWIGAVETGSEILAAAGLLDHCEVPVHWYNAKGSAERYRNLHVTQTLFDMTDSRLLSAGGTATLDMMLALVARLAGDDLAMEVAKHLLVDGRRPGSRPQPRIGAPLPALDPDHHRHDAVARAHAIMERTIDEPLSVAEMAHDVGISTRHLQRLFRARLGRGMEATYRELRLAKAHQLVQQTETSLTEIAIACGFSSLAVFSRTYRSRFGVTPSRDRRQSVETSVYSTARAVRDRGG